MAEGTVHIGSPVKFPTKPTEEWIFFRKMYVIKQIKICAEYWDMLPSHGLGSMSRYSAQILICITSLDQLLAESNED